MISALWSPFEGQSIENSFRRARHAMEVERTAAWQSLPTDVVAHQELTRTQHAAAVEVSS